LFVRIGSEKTAMLHGMAWHAQFTCHVCDLTIILEVVADPEIWF
jgi:hypothetical protein